GRGGREQEWTEGGGKREIESQRQGAHVGSRRDADSGEHETHATVLDDQTAQEHARRSPPGAGVGEECRSGDRRTWYLHLSDLLRADLLRAVAFRADLLRANHLVSPTRAAAMKATDVPRAVELAACILLEGRRTAPGGATHDDEQTGGLDHGDSASRARAGRVREPERTRIRR